jgi:hypothetical protein
LLLLAQQLLNPPALGVIFRLKQQFPETLDVFAPDEAFDGRTLADRPPRCDRATQGAQAAVRPSQNGRFRRVSRGPGSEDLFPDFAVGAGPEPPKSRLKRGILGYIGQRVRWDFVRLSERSG